MTVAGNLSETTLAEACYLYTLAGTDNVGNTASTTVTVVVDKTAPASNGLSISSATHAFFAVVTGTNTLFYKGNTTGSPNLADAVNDIGLRSSLGNVPRCPRLRPHQQRTP